MSSETDKPGVKRRQFLKVVGATGAAATAIGCSSERVEKLIPYFVSPDETVPGVSTYYATTCRECSASCGVIAETRDGRAIKLEGNPDHPLNRGALCARGQAALQGLYNPDRYRAPMYTKRGAAAPFARASAKSSCCGTLAPQPSRKSAPKEMISRAAAKSNRGQAKPYDSRLAAIAA
jgi:hypothetical protein